MVVIKPMNRFYPPFFNYPNNFNKRYYAIPPNISKNSMDNIERKSTTKPIFELFGIELYKDDILILLLIYFLYIEKNEDFLLYILLFSLILS